MSSSRVDRLLWMQQKLMENGIIYKRQCAERFAITPKTVQRDIDVLRDYYSESGKDLAYDRGVDGYRLLDTDAMRLTNSEVLAVCKILLESRSMVEAEMDPILDKLIACCSPRASMKAVEELVANERFHYVPPHHGCKFVDKLWELGQAVQQHRVLEMEYRGTHDHAVRSRRVQPVGILFSEYYFYLAAFIEGIDRQMHFDNPEDKSPTIYRVDKIESYRMTGEHFAVPYRDRFQEGEMRKRIQFMYGGKLQRIRFLYTGPSLEAVLDRLPTARVTETLPYGKGSWVEAEVFGSGIDMWLRSQGEYVQSVEKRG